MVWKVKEIKKGKKQKKVSFADPIATELKPPKPNMMDDSIMLIKGNYHTQSSFCTSSPIVDPLEVETFSISDLLVPPHTEMEATKGHF
jgi:hypothetical protein